MLAHKDDFVYLKSPENLSRTLKIKAVVQLPLRLWKDYGAMVVVLIGGIAVGWEKAKCGAE